MDDLDRRINILRLFQQLPDQKCVQPPLLRHGLFRNIDKCRGANRQATAVDTAETSHLPGDAKSDVRQTAVGTPHLNAACEAVAQPNAFGEVFVGCVQQTGFGVGLRGDRKMHAADFGVVEQAQVVSDHAGFGDVGPFGNAAQFFQIVRTKEDIRLLHGVIKFEQLLPPRTGQIGIAAQNRPNLFAVCLSVLESHFVRRSGKSDDGQAAVVGNILRFFSRGWDCSCG